MLEKKSILKPALFAVTDIGVVALNNICIPKDTAFYGIFTTAFVLLAFKNLININKINEEKKIAEIKELYEEFLNNYSELNGTFGFYDPVQVYAMFIFSLWNGYLSNNKTFEYSEGKTNDLIKLQGSIIFSGNAVCRHIAQMLVDIFNYNGVEAHALPVYNRTYDLDIRKSDTYRTKEELYSWLKQNIKDSGEYKEALKRVNYFLKRGINDIDLSLKLEEDPSIFRRIIGNHLISYVHKKRDYFFDPTCVRILEMSRNKKGVLVDHGIEIPIKKAGLMVKSDYKCMKALRELNTPSLEEIDDILGEAIEICFQNQDIFEQFYKHNHDLYKEISDKALKLSK